MGCRLRTRMASQVRVEGSASPSRTSRQTWRAVRSGRAQVCALPMHEVESNTVPDIASRVSRAFVCCSAQRPAWVDGFSGPS